jgi:WD40 repeat protein
MAELNENTFSRAADAPAELASPIVALAFRPDGTQIVAARERGTIDVRATMANGENRRIPSPLSAGSGEFDRIALSPDARRLAASREKTIWSWETMNSGGTPKTKSFDEAQGPLLSMVFNSRGDRVAAVYGDRKVRLFKIEERFLNEVPSANDPITCAVFLDEAGDQMAWGSKHSSVMLWDRKATEDVRDAVPDSSGPTLLQPRETRLAFSPNGQFVAIASCFLGVPPNAMGSVGPEVRPGGEKVTVPPSLLKMPGSEEAKGWFWSEIRVCNTTTGRVVFGPCKLDVYIPQIALGPDGRTIAIVGGIPLDLNNGRVAGIWDLGTGRKIQTFPAESIDTIALSPDGQRVATGHKDKTIRIRDVSSGQMQFEFGGNEDVIWRLAFSPDNRSLVAGFENGALKAWDLTTHGKPSDVGHHDDAVRFLAFSLDGKRLLAASKKGSIKVWDTTTVTEQLSCPEQPDWNSAPLAVSPDGKRFAAGSLGASVKVWDLVTSQAVLTLRGHEDAVTSVAFSPDGKTLISCDRRGTARFWRAASEEEVQAASK